MYSDMCTMMCIYTDSNGVHSDISMVNVANESDIKETRWDDKVPPSPRTDGEGYMEPLCSKSLYQNTMVTITSPYEEPMASESRQKQVPNSKTREVNHYHQLLPEARHPSPLVSVVSCFMLVDFRASSLRRLEVMYPLLLNLQLPWHTGAPLNSEMQPLYGNVSAKV